MEGLNSADTSEYNEARGALSYYNFTAEELPYVYTALQKTHPDDTSRLGARYKLIEILKDVHDNNTISQLQNLYTNLQGRDELDLTVRIDLDVDGTRVEVRPGPEPADVPQRQRLRN